MNTSGEATIVTQWFLTIIRCLTAGLTSMISPVAVHFINAPGATADSFLVWPARRVTSAAAAAANPGHRRHRRLADVSALPVVVVRRSLAEVKRPLQVSPAGRDPRGASQRHQGESRARNRLGREVEGVGNYACGTVAPRYVFPVVCVAQLLNSNKNQKN